MKGRLSVKRTLMHVVVLALLLLFAAMPAFAGGDQCRGDNAQGSAVQVQVQDPPPFQP
jgi:predicted S18 family serine protease